MAGFVPLWDLTQRKSQRVPAPTGIEWFLQVAVVRNGHAFQPLPADPLGLRAVGRIGDKA